MRALSPAILAPSAALLFLFAGPRGAAQTPPPTPSPEHWNVPNGPAIPGLEHGTFPSAAVKATVGFTVWTPPEYAEPARRFPVLYFLHGAGGNEYSAAGDISTRLAEAIRQKTLPPLLCVFCNADHSGYRDDPATGILGESEIVQELVPLIDARYRTLPGRRALAGFSMGASGAVRLAVKHPEAFVAAIGWGGGYRGTADSARANLAQLQQTHLGLLLVIGEKDNVPLNQAFTAELDALALPYTFKLLPGVAHDYAAYLRETWPDAVKLLAERLTESSAK